MIHKTMRSILSVLLAALLLVTSTPLTPAFADGGAVSPQSESAEGRVLKPVDGVYQIYTADDLKEFAKLVNGTDGNSADPNAHAKLMNDIDLSSVCGPMLDDGNPVSWTPIGSDSNEYTGTFNGDGHTISGLYIDSNSANYQGLFGYVSGNVSTGGTVKDLSVSGTVSGNNFVGGVVGVNSGSVINCTNTGSVKGSGNRVGGVVGYNNGGTVKNCYNTGNISGNISYNDSGHHVGGVVGYNSGSVENCHNIGSVSGNSYVGGVVGVNSSTVKNCYNTGSVKGRGIHVGGVVGNNGGSVTNCYNTGKVTGSSSYSYIGGVVGYNSGPVKNCYNTGTVTGNRVGGVVGYNISSVTNCYNTGSVSGDGYVGGVVGLNSSSDVSGTVTDCYFLTGTAEKGIGSDTSEPDETAVDDLDALCKALKGDTWTISENLDRPVLKDNHEDDGSKDHPYEIFTATQLETFRDIVNGANGQRQNKFAHAKLMENIDLSEICGESAGNWTPIGNSIGNSYEGTFNGDGHTISGLYINDSTADDQGLFGFVSGTVQNLSVSGTVNSSGDYVGGIVGYNFSGTVTNCAFSGSVSGVSFVGGVVGYNGGTVKNCYNTGAVSGGMDVGGVVGENSGSVTNCYNTGTGSVNGSADSSNVGGVVGLNRGTVENCYNTGTVSGSDHVGGVVGRNDGTVKNCYNIGEVSGNSSGGVVGYNNGGSVTGCYFLQTADVNVGRPGIGEGSGDATEKDDTAFHSGEVAYLLQSKQTTPVWGQNIGEDKSPVLTSDQEKNVYKVTINLNDSDSTENETRYTNSDLQALTPTREGYTFDGWYESADCSGEAVTTITDLTNTTATLYAKWKANEYKVTLHTNDGTIAEGQNVTSYIYGVGAKLPTENEITKTGYIFAGWYNNADLTGDPVTEISKTDINDKAYWAKWEEVENPEPTPTPTPDPTPSGPSTDGSSGWDDIRDELEDAAKGDQITIDMGDETKVPAEIFESLAGKDVDVTFDLGDIQWSVNGADIPTDTDFTDLDLGVNLDTHGIPVNVINTITGEVGTVQITLAHDGDFGFTMTLTAPLGAKNAGYWANLYHYDEDAEQLTFETAAEIDADGNAALPLSHASQYAIVIDTHSHATVDVSDLFSDIAPDAWYKDAVQYAYDNGLMTGVSATEFAPEATTTRAMIVSILARLENVTTAEAAGFADVDDNDWYATAVNWAANVGVVNGYEDNTFQPNTAITREQLAAILMNYAAYKGEDVSNRADLTSYTDQPSTWAQEAMQWAVAEGLISGVTNDQLQPQSSATRAQVAAILQRLLEA